MRSHTAKSSVSRRCVNATAGPLVELVSRQLDEEPWLICSIDAFGLGGHTAVADLADRGPDAENTVLFVIDGDKAVANAIRDVSGDQAVSLAAEATRHATSVIAGPRPNDRCPSGGWARPSHPDPDAAHAELDALANKRPGAA